MYKIIPRSDLYRNPEANHAIGRDWFSEEEIEDLNINGSMDFDEAKQIFQSMSINMGISDPIVSDNVPALRFFDKKIQKNLNTLLEFMKYKTGQDIQISHLLLDDHAGMYIVFDIERNRRTEMPFSMTVEYCQLSSDELFDKLKRLYKGKYT